MNRLILLVFLISYNVAIFAQVPDTLWTNTFGEAATDEFGNFVQQTKDGYKDITISGHVAVLDTLHRQRKLL